MGAIYYRDILHNIYCSTYSSDMYKRDILHYKQLYWLPQTLAHLTRNGPKVISCNNYQHHIIHAGPFCDHKYNVEHNVGNKKLYFYVKHTPQQENAVHPSEL